MVYYYCSMPVQHELEVVVPLALATFKSKFNFVVQVEPAGLGGPAPGRLPVALPVPATAGDSEPARATGSESAAAEWPESGSLSGPQPRAVTRRRVGGAAAAAGGALCQCSTLHSLAGWHIPHSGCHWQCCIRVPLAVYTTVVILVPLRAFAFVYVPVCEPEMPLAVTVSLPVVHCS